MGVISSTNTNKWHYIPDQVKKMFKTFKRGRIRDMAFCPDGTIKKIYVSKKFKYKKVFHPIQFGVAIKPIIFQSDDKYDLIKNGLAVEDKI
jgi:hypothetical protein